LRPAGETQSALLEQVVAFSDVAPATNPFETFHKRLGTEASVRIEVEEPYFGRPWAKLIAGPWNDPSGKSAGRLL
jgi:hypothetical protein